MPRSSLLPHPSSSALSGAVLVLVLGAVLALGALGGPVFAAPPGGGSEGAQGGATPAPADGGAVPPAAASGAVIRIRVDSIIQPIAAEFILDAVREADDSGATALVIELSTPGGLMTSTRKIFTGMLGASTPVVVWVAPSGAQAASAGFFILMAGDVAAMAPGTNTGASAVVGGQGEDIPGKMGEKVQQDAAATIRSLAARRGRDQALAEKAVLEARSFTADEALKAGLIDLEAPSFARLLQELDGRQVEKNGRTLTLATRDAAVREVQMSGFRRFLSALAHPNIAYLLLTLGGLGLYFELMNPGAVFPGVFGAIALILGFFALSVLPVNYAGVALIFLAIVFFIAEVKIPSYGLLTVAGVTSLILGSLMLFKSPEPALRVSLGLVATLAAFSLLLVLFLAGMTVRHFRSAVRTGSEGLLGELGRARSPIAPRGKVFVHGEIWEAVADEPIAAGVPVEVVEVQGMILKVRSAAGAQPLAPDRTAGMGETAAAQPIETTNQGGRVPP